MENCWVLVNWLCLATTVENEGEEQRICVPVPMCHELIALAIDEDLLQQQQPILESNLPSQNQLNQRGVEGSILQLVTAVAGNTWDSQEAWLARDKDKAQDKLPSQWWTALIHKLLEYCNVTSELHLPHVWLVLVKSSKKQDISIMQDAMTTYPRGPNGI